MKQFLFLAFLLSSFFSAGQENDPYFYPFKEADGWGVKRANGQELFPERYDAISISSNVYTPYKNRIRVKKNGKWGVVDSFGVELIPVEYPSIEIDEFGYDIGTNNDYLNGTRGFLSLNGDTLVPFDNAFYSTLDIGGRGDFLILALKSARDEGSAIYSSDGIRRTDYDFADVIGIDSLQMMKSVNNIPQYYFGVHSLKTDKYGVYDGVNKRIVVEPIYDYVCVSWCALSKNPQLHPGPVAYTGTTPVFHMQTGDDMRLINTRGDIIFSSNDVVGWDEKKKYYVNENGDAREVLGEHATNYSGNDDPPYVMKDSEGYFFVDSTGTSLLDDKRFLGIVKYNHSSDKRREANLFVVSNEYYQKSILDHSLNERIPPKYVSVDFYKRNLICKKGDNTYDFYDSLLVLLDYDPSEESDEVIREQNYFFTEVIENPSKGLLYGIKSKENEVLIPPKYFRSEFVGKYKTRSDSSFYILSNGESVDVFSERLELLMHFEADNYSFYEPWTPGGRSFLRLAKQNKFGLYDLSAKEWLFQDKPCISIDSILLHKQRKDGLILSSRIEWYKNEPYFWVYDQLSGWNLYDMQGNLYLKWKRQSSVPPKIVYREGEFTFAMQQIERQDELVCYLANHEGNEWIESRRLIGYHFVPELDRVFLSFPGRENTHLVLDNHLNVLGEINGTIRTYPNRAMYIHLDLEDSICRYVYDGGEVVMEDATWINNRGKGIYNISTTNGNFLITQYSNGFTKRYLREPDDFTKEVIGCMIEDAPGNRRYDFYNFFGELLFENYRYRERYRSRGMGGYMIIDNEDEELWLTHDGTVFHRNKLE